MQVQGLYAAVYVGDMQHASAFYARLLGREPDDKPFDTLVQWRFAGAKGIQLFQDAAKAGRGVMTIVVPDLEALKAALSGEGIAVGDFKEGNFGKIAHVTDPDGNVVTLAEPPKA